MLKFGKRSFPGRVFEFDACFLILEKVCLGGGGSVFVDVREALKFFLKEAPVSKKVSELPKQGRQALKFLEEEGLIEKERRSWWRPTEEGFRFWSEWKDRGFPPPVAWPGLSFKVGAFRVLGGRLKGIFY